LGFTASDFHRFFITESYNTQFPSIPSALLTTRAEYAQWQWLQENCVYVLERMDLGSFIAFLALLDAALGAPVPVGPAPALETVDMGNRGARGLLVMPTSSPALCSSTLLLGASAGPKGFDGGM
jgi:hypothetical protein